jgi:DNA-binding LytR/AlgR family response regulator
MIRCMIVEDEVLAQQVIEAHLQKAPGFRLDAICRNGAEARKVLEGQEIDLIFLDVQLPGMTGLDFLRSLVDPPLVVLTTAYPEYALESYEFSVIDYLLKPISFERFSKMLGKISEGRLFSQAGGEKIRPSSEHIFIKSGNKFFKVNYAEILYIQGMKDYLKIHTPDYRLVTHQTMSEMERLLSGKEFLRVHKSYIVAVPRIKSIFSNSIEIDQATIPIGSSYREGVMKYISGRSGGRT